MASISSWLVLEPPLGLVVVILGSAEYAGTENARPKRMRAVLVSRFQTFKNVT